MSQFQPIEAKQFVCSPFQAIGKEWMLITAESEGRVNTMTASWGALGEMWGKNAVFIVVRDSRFTKTLLDASDTFSLSFLDHEKYQKELSYLGRVSGRDEDKFQGSGLHAEYRGLTPFVGEASRVLICRKMFRQKMEPGHFLQNDIDAKWYADQDYHDLYVGEVLEILEHE